MTTSKKIELTSGIVTGLFGTALTVIMVYKDYATSLRLKNDFSALAAFAICSPFYMWPSVLIAVGTYFHAVSGKSWGRFLVLVPGIFLIATFLLFTFTAGYGAAYMIWPRFLLIMVAIITIIVGSWGVYDEKLR
jgi:hypothetical protein